MWTISVIAGLESVAIIKAVSDNRILSFETSVIIFCVFALNHAILHLYTIVVYPELISPLRRIPRGKVRLSALGLGTCITRWAYGLMFAP